MAERQVAPAGVGIIHVHSNYSHDGRDPLEQLREVSLARGIAFIGMTDHAEDFDPARYVEFQEHCRSLSDQRLRIIPGLEYRFRGYSGLHLLALGLTRMILPETPEQFCREAPILAQFTIVAHPILPAYQIPEVVGESLDAIEVWNAAYNTRFLPDTRAIRLYHALARRRPGMVATAGLDQHDSRNDREARVILTNPDAADPLAELKAGRFTNRGRTVRFDAHASFGPLHLASLSLARWSLNQVNRVHETVVRWMPSLARKPS